MYVYVYFHMRIVFRNTSVMPCSINPMRYSPVHTQLMNARRWQFCHMVREFSVKKTRSNTAEDSRMHIT